MSRISAVNFLPQVAPLGLVTVIGLILFGCTPSELIIPDSSLLEFKRLTVPTAVLALAYIPVRPPIYSAWTTFHERGAELREFGMYTYVLFGHDLSQTASQEHLIRKRYESLLTEITKSWRYDQFSEVLKKEDVNLFCIPAKHT